MMTDGQTVGLVLRTVKGQAANSAYLLNQNLQMYQEPQVPSEAPTIFQSWGRQT